MPYMDGMGYESCGGCTPPKTNERLDTKKTSPESLQPEILVPKLHVFRVRLSVFWEFTSCFFSNAQEKVPKGCWAIVFLFTGLLNG